MFMHYSSGIVVFQQTKQHFKNIHVDDLLHDTILIDDNFIL